MTQTPMKTFRCPVCGHFLLLFDDLFQQEAMDYGYYEDRSVFFYLCSNCTLASEYGITEEEAFKKAEELISKFPPIMRVHSGDKIRHIYQRGYYRSQPQIITEVNVQKGVMKVEGHIGLIHPNEVTTWPWELE